MKTRDVATVEGSSSSARVIAEQLAAEAERFRRDAETDTRTAALLTGLAADGYEVLHDLSLPQSKAHVDHLVVGASGAYTIDSRHYRRRLSIDKGMLWCGTYSLAKELKAARADAAQVEEVLKAAGCATPTVEPVMAVHALAGQEVAGKDGHLVVDGVHIVVAERLLSFVKGRPHALNLPDVTQLATEARAVMRPAVGAKHRRATASRIPSRPQEHGLDAPAGGRRRDRDLVQLAVGLVVIALLGWLVPTVLGRSDDGSQAAKEKASETAAAAPGPLGVPTGEFVCPAPGAGWAHELRWPEGTDLTGRQIEWGATAEGPWRVAALDPPKGLAPVTTVHYRVRSGADAGSGIEATAAFPTPETAC